MMKLLNIDIGESPHNISTISLNTFGSTVERYHEDTADAIGATGRMASVIVDGECAAPVAKSRAETLDAAGAPAAKNRAETVAVADGAAATVA